LSSIIYKLISTITFQFLIKLRNRS